MAEEKEKRIRNDEETLARVLEAAYIVQEYNRELQEMKLGPKPKEQTEKEHPKNLSPSDAVPTETVKAEQQSASTDDYDSTLAKIVETQFEIQSENVGFQQAVEIIAARLTQITRAAGVGIAFFEDEEVCYRAVAGSPTVPAAARLPAEKTLCSACRRTGEVVRTGEGGSASLLESSESRALGAQFAIAVPIFQGGGIAGGVELYYPSRSAFRESDVHSCQLVASLISEARSRDALIASKASPVSKRTVMPDSIDEHQTEGRQTGGHPEEHHVDASSAAAMPPSPESASIDPVAEPAEDFICGTCGHELVGEEQFCGKCGTPRSVKSDPPTLQSKVAALWHMQEAKRKSVPPIFSDTSHDGDDSHADPSSLRSEMHGTGSTKERGGRRRPHEDSETLSDSETGDLVKALPESELSPTVRSEENTGEESNLTTTEKLEQLADWSSAANTREYLEQLADVKPSGPLARFWNLRRGDVYLALAVILTAFVIRWEMSSDHSAVNSSSPATQHRPAPDAGLSFFDRLLIGVGLAEPPEPTDYKGNPEVRVWVDLRTALYYCPGGDLYGKTEKGKFTSQRDAQLDQFQPAYRKACD